MEDLVKTLFPVLFNRALSQGYSPGEAAVSALAEYNQVLEAIKPEPATKATKKAE